MTDIHYGRKRSGIKRELKNKVEEWLESIDDEELRSLARKNVIVTGGSIASMLLGEKVNDYDIYFRDLDTTRKVAEYYVRKFNDATAVRSDVAPVVPEVQVSNDRVKIFIKSAGIAAEKQSTNYDYFESRTEEETEEFLEGLTEGQGKKYRPVFMSENAITLSDKIQLIVRFYGEPNQIHDNYDFVHATCYWDHTAEHLELPSEALECLLSRTLIYRGSLYPIASIFRMKKFLERGWRITAGQQLKIMWQISELDLRDMNVLYEQLTGVDMMYMYLLRKALENEEVTSEKLNASYVGAIIDRIFDEAMR